MRSFHMSIPQTNWQMKLKVLFASPLIPRQTLRLALFPEAVTAAKKLKPVIMIFNRTQY